MNDDSQNELTIDLKKAQNPTAKTSIIQDTPSIPDNPQKIRNVIKNEVDALTTGFIDGSLNYDEYLSKLTDLDQIDSAHMAAFNIWDTLTRQDITDKILNSQPISKLMQMQDGSIEQLPVDPIEKYYNLLGLEYLHVMQILAIFEDKPSEAKEFLFKDPEIIKQIREHSLTDAARDYLDGTLAYWRGDLETLHSILDRMENYLGETDIEKEMNGLNLDVLKRLYNGLKTRGTVNYAYDYAGIVQPKNKVI